MTPSAVPITPVPEPTPITHPSHPFWSGFTWDKLLRIIQIAAAIAPAVVAIADSKDPDAIAKAKQLGDLTGGVIGGVLADGKTPVADADLSN